VQFEAYPATSSLGSGHGFFGTTSMSTPTFYPTTDVDAGLYIIPVPAGNYGGGDSISFPQGGVYVIQFLFASQLNPTPNELAIVSSALTELYNVSILFESKNLNYSSTEDSFIEVAIVHCSDDSSFILPGFPNIEYLYGTGAWINMVCWELVITRLS